MKDKIQTDLKAAMKSGDKLRMMALRGVLSEISRLEKDVRRDPNDAEILQIIKRERAKREESLEFARKAARQDLVEQNETEAKILDSYLPAAASALRSCGRVNPPTPRAPIFKKLRRASGP